MKKYYGVTCVLILIPAKSRTNAYITLLVCLNDLTSSIIVNCCQPVSNISSSISNFPRQTLVVDMRGSLIELATLDVILLVFIFVFVSISCCYLGAKCAQHECRCKICKNIIRIESGLGSGRFGSVFTLLHIIGLQGF